MKKRIVLFLLTQPSPSGEGYYKRELLLLALKPSPDGEGWGEEILKQILFPCLLGFVHLTIVTDL
jgi:hypothetical protein